MKTSRIIQRTVRTEKFNKWTGQIDAEEETFWIVQERCWLFPFWMTVGYEVETGVWSSEWHDFKFPSYEKADEWRRNWEKGNKKKVTDVILD